MSELILVKPKRIWLRDEPSLDEKWVQQQIADEPSILGLGDLILKDKERQQPRAGRLDLLLQESDSSRRYEVELQLGKTDESHIIRTLEYWDIERKRYPQYEHCAVIIAEDITSRFLNVIGLFNGHIPLIAIQLGVYQIENQIALIFTKVVDELTIGLVDEDEEVTAVTDRAYWEDRGSKETLAMADEVLEMIRVFEPEIEFKYNKFYIGLAKSGQPCNFVIFRVKKNHLRVELRLPETDETTNELESAGLDLMDYEKRWKKYRIRFTKADFEKHHEVLAGFVKQAYEEWQS